MEQYAYTFWNWNKETDPCVSTAPLAPIETEKAMEGDRELPASQPKHWLDSSRSDSTSLEFDAQACPTYFLM
jgi:hypothetical protein